MVESGILLLKYWLEVSREEQQRRLKARIDDPRKFWKLSPMDLEVVWSMVRLFPGSRRHVQSDGYAVGLLSPDLRVPGSGSRTGSFGPNKRVRSHAAASPMAHLLLVVDHNASLDVAVMHACEDVVDVFEFFRRDGRLDLALASEVQRFLQIQSCSDDRTANGNAPDHGAED